jgi:hypothetical protein
MVSEVSVGVGWIYCCGSVMRQNLMVERDGVEDSLTSWHTDSRVREKEL